MSTFRSEVVNVGQLVDVDFSHPLTNDLFSAFVPSIGSGNDLTDIATGDTYAFTSVEWRGDGVATDGSVEVDSGSFNTHNYANADFIIVADVNIINSGGGEKSVLFELSESANQNRHKVYIEQSNYNKGLTVGITHNYAPIIEETGNRVALGAFSGIVAIHYDYLNQLYTVYGNGVVLATCKFNSYRASNYRISVLRGGNISITDSKLRSVQFYSRLGSFTSEEVSTLVSDPYQVFLPVNEAATDYGLKGNGTDAYGSVDITSNGNPDPKWNLKIKFNDMGSSVKGTTSFHRLLGGSSTADATNRVIGNGTGTDIRFYRNNIMYKWTPSAFEYSDTIVEFNVGGNSSGIELLLDGVSQGFQNAGNPTGCDLGLLGVNIDNFYDGTFEYVTFTNHLEPTFSRLYDCNQANSQPYIPELINGQHGTLVNFPTPSGYVRELDSHGGVEFRQNQYGQLPTVLGIQVGQYLEIDFTILDVTQTAWLLSNSTSWNSRIYLHSAENEVAFDHEYTHAETRMSVGSVNISQPLILRVERLTTDSFRMVLTDTSSQVVELTSYYHTSSPTEFDTIAGSGNGYVSSDHNVNMTRIELGVISTSQKLISYDFTKAQGYTVADTVGGNDASLVGFNNVYYRPEASGDLVGYRFNGESYATLPLWTVPNEDNYTIECKFRINDLSTNCAIFGGAFRFLYFYSATKNLGYTGHNESNPTLIPNAINDNEWHTVVITKVGSTITLDIDGGENVDTGATSSGETRIDRLNAYTGAQGIGYVSIEYLNITHATDSRNYDFTTGDADQIIDTVGGNHATIVNAPTSGYLPIVEKQVYTFGAQKDFTTLDAFNAQSQEDAVNELIIFEHVAESGQVLLTAPNRTLTLTAHDSVSDEILLSDISIRGGNNSGLVFNGIRGLNFTTGDYGNVSSIAINNCNFTTDIALNKLVSNGDMTTTIRSSVVGGYRTGLGWNETIVAYDSIFFDLGGYGTNEGVSATSTLYNCIGFQKDSYQYNNRSIFSSDIQGASNISKNASTALETVITQKADIESAFADPANGDYRIKQSYADANLVGAGWNGSDIASWAYYDDTVANVVAKTFNISWDKLSLLTVMHTQQWNKQVNSTDYITPRDLNVQWDKSESTQRTLNLSWSNSESIQRTLNVNWDKLKTSSSSINVQWDKSESIQRTLNVQWDKSESVQRTLNVSWSNSESIQRTLNVNWDKLKTSSSSINFQWDKSESTQRTLNVSWDKSSLVSTQCLVNWSKVNEILTPVTPSTIQLGWDKNSTTNVNFKMHWNKLKIPNIISPEERMVLISYDNRGHKIIFENRILTIKR